MWRFDDIEIDPLRFEVRRGGALVEVEPRVFDVIRCLLERAPAVVTRDELFAAVWTDTRVGDAALSRAIREARRALGDDGRRQRWIRTVHGRGYRFADLDHAPSSGRSEARPTEAPCFGREDELERLLVAARAARHAPGGTAWIHGPAGIGKSVLLRRFAAAARTEGFWVVEGAASREPGAPVWWPWRQILAAVLDSPAGRALRDDATTACAGLEAAREPGCLADEMRRFALRGDVIRGLRAATKAAPLLVLLDDFDAADTASQELCTSWGRALREEPGLLVLTTGQPPSRAWQPAISVELSGLDDRALRAWLDATRPGARVDDALVAKVRAVTGGHPLHVQQLLWSVPGDELADFLERPLSRDLRGVVTRSLSLAAPEVRTVVEAVAVGGEVTVAMVASALERPLDEVIAASETALRAGWLCRIPGSSALGLPHASVRRAVVEATSPPWRARMHGCFGVAWLATAGPDAVERAAQHLNRAAASTRIDAGIDAACRAAELAFSRGAFDRAADHARTALASMGLMDTPHPQQRAVTMHLAAAAGRAGDLVEAAACFDAASRMPAAKRAPGGSPTDEDLRAVRASFRAVAADLPSLVRETYSHLFGRWPETAPLFHRRRPEAQQAMLADTLTAVVEHLEDAPWLAERVTAIGASHQRYGVTPEMFDWFGQALFTSLEAQLGPAWTPALAASWARAYAALSEAVVAAMA